MNIIQVVRWFEFLVVTYNRLKIFNNVDDDLLKSVLKVFLQGSDLSRFLQRNFKCFGEFRLFIIHWVLRSCVLFFWRRQVAFFLIDGNSAYLRLAGQLSHYPQPRLLESLFHRNRRFCNTLIRNGDIGSGTEYLATFPCVPDFHPSHPID